MLLAVEFLPVSVVLAAPAAAHARIVVFPTLAHEVAPFVEWLQIQLVHRAEVLLGPPLPEGTSADDARILQVLAEVGGQLAVWISAPPNEPGSHATVVFARGRDSTRHAMEVARVVGGQSAAPEELRALALKVGEVMVDVLSPEPPRASVSKAVRDEMARSATVPPPPAPPSPASPSSSSTSESGGLGPLHLELQAIGSTAAGGAEAGWQGGVGLGIGAFTVTHATRFEGVAVVDRLFPSSTDRGGASVSLGDFRATLGMGVTRSFGAFAAGLGVRAGVHVLDAQGSFQGREGGAWRAGPIVLAMPEIRVPFAPRASLRAAAGGEWTLRADDFSVQGDTLANRHGWRWTAELGFIFELL